MQKPKFFTPKRVAGAKKFNPHAKIDAMYTSEEWVSFRARFLAVNKTCYACGGKAEVADHLVSHKGDEGLFKKEDNIIPLCHKCHNTITAKFDRKYILGQDIKEKLTWISLSRGRNLVDSRVFVIPWKEKLTRKR